ncbi:DGQHR domain-containing protein DpdB [Dyella japonica]|uniref:DGQHR domain-containing protein n=1 Tax=Dyella japonica TaxID=231455 RepID=A0ABV2JWA3_9GAMM
MKAISGFSIRALRSFQAGIPLYTFFLPGATVLEIADICRLSRSKNGLDGFQREAIQRHIQGMVQYLDSGNVIFPNAILLALSPRASFTRSRGPAPEGLIDASDSGVLKLPRPSDGSKCAWIVDGQQRSTALARAQDSSLPVPVVAFVSDNLQVHREQFILVNKARPLPKRLVDELLPEVDAAHLPVDMAMRQIPSALVDRLDADPSSPFFGMIRRTTTGKDPKRVVTDSALVRSLQRQIHQPLGALASFRSLDGASTNPSGMFSAVVQFWAAVKESFPSAWNLPPEQSRLTHSAGIESVSALMDYLMPRAVQQDDPQGYLVNTLRRIAPSCAWTNGVWPDLNCAWNEIESTSKDIRRLTDQLIRLVQSPNLRQVA